MTLQASTTSTSTSSTVATAVFPWWRSAVVLAIGLGTVALCLLQGRPNAFSEPGVTMDLPYKIGTYWGTREETSMAEKLLLPPDTTIERKMYDSLSGDKILCSIVLSGIERRSIHRPEICLPGQGWTIEHSRNVPVTLASGKTLYVKELLLGRDVVVGPKQTHKIQSVYYYWFVGKNFTTPEHSTRVFYGAWDLLMHNINHRWAYVIATSVVSNTVQRNGKDILQTQQMLKEFIRDIVPTFQLSEMPKDSQVSLSPK